MRKNQHYALNSEGEIIHIDKADKGTSFFCLYCKQEMIPKKGVKNEWHYAHKEITVSCSYESYLHQLAKHLICEWLNQAEEVILSLPISVVCNQLNDCYWFKNAIHANCTKEITKPINLKEYYNSCTIEKQYKGYQADILMHHTEKENREPIFIEICVTHSCDQKKINSEIKIIEFKINSETDIDTILSSSIKKSDKTQLHNFKIKREESDEFNIPLRRFTLFESNKGYPDEITCKTTNKRESKAIFDFTIEDNDFPLIHGFYNTGLVAAYKHGYRPKSCDLCNKRKTDNYDMKLCYWYKGKGIEKYCPPSQAWECKDYVVNQAFIHEIEEEINQTKYQIWRRDKNAQ